MKFLKSLIVESVNSVELKALTFESFNEQPKITPVGN
jgi:hypothetical protein